MGEQREITAARSQGQIVTVQSLRKELQIKQNTKLAVYRREDKLVVAKLAIPPLGEELKSPSGEIDQQVKGKKKTSEEQRVKKRKHKTA